MAIDLADFFWKKDDSTNARFNLLLLEYSEIYHESLSCYHITAYPNINDEFKGKLHVSSRSLIFEPEDTKKSLMKFLYKNFISPLERFQLQNEEILQCSSTTSGFVTFKISGYFEIKDNDKIGPYKYKDNDDRDITLVFALIHSDPQAFLFKISRLREELILYRAEGLRGIPFKPKPISFDLTLLEDFHEKLAFPYLVSALKLSPLILHPGGLMITNINIYFQPSNLNNVGDLVQHFDIKSIKRIFSRRYLLKQTGMEILFITDKTKNNDSNGSSNSSNNNRQSVRSVYFVFESKAIRDRMATTIKSSPSFPRRINDEESLLIMAGKWQRKELSNFEYLLFVNTEAHRSFIDLTQYPIMPHIIADYQSNVLDLTKEETFRDLSKPIGALNSQRLQFFKERYASMISAQPHSNNKVRNGYNQSNHNNNQSYQNSEYNHDIESNEHNTSSPPPFLYGSHYSTPAYVLFYLVRVAPEHMLCLQNGKFDAPDRLFSSLGKRFFCYCFMLFFYC